MRGRRNPQITMLAFIDLEERVPTSHPLRTVKRLADEALTDLSSTFDEMYTKDGRPSIPPERLLKASLLIALHSVRSERAFCEELEYNLLFRGGSTGAPRCAGSWTWTRSSRASSRPSSPRTARAS
jgi:transposase